MRRTAEDLDIIRSLVGTLKEIRHLDAVLQASRDADASDGISATTHRNAVSLASRVLESAWRTLRRRAFAEDPAMRWDFPLFLSPHTVESVIRRVAKLPPGEVRGRFDEFLIEARVVAGALDRMKSKVVVRKPAKSPEPVRGYHPPAASTEAERTVVSLLHELTEQAREELSRLMEREERSRVDVFVRAVASIPPRGDDTRTDVVTRFLVSESDGLEPAEAGMIADAMLRDVRPYLAEVSRPKSFDLRPDLDAFMHARAEEEADSIRSMFVRKNFRKIASVVETKGNLKEGSILGRRIGLGSLEGRFRFVFEDGSRFDADNSVVRSVSVHGRRFLRFPLTFREVYFADGEKMELPSEARMNEVFAVDSRSTGRRPGF